MPPTSYDYQAFSLKLRSEVRLWPGSECPTTTGTADVEFVRGTQPIPDIAPRFRLSSDNASLRIQGAGALRVLKGSRVELYPENSAAALAALTIFAAGAALAMILTQRGWFCVHGSSVLIGERAVCFCGPQGAGKSTLAAALARAGHRLVADGMTVLRVQDGSVVTCPGPRLSKLWPDSLQFFGERPSDFCRVTEFHDKRLVPMARPQEPQALFTLNELCILSTGKTPARLALAPQNALMEVQRNAFLAEYVAPEDASQLLRASADLTERLPINKLVRGHSFEEIPQLLALVVSRPESNNRA